MTVHVKRATLVDGIVQEYARRVGLDLQADGIETVVGDLISDLMHSVAASSPTGADKARGLDAARSGISHFVTQSGLSVSDLESGDLGEKSLVSIKVSSGTEVWTSITGTSATVENFDLEMAL